MPAGAAKRRVSAVRPASGQRGRGSADRRQGDAGDGWVVGTRGSMVMIAVWNFV